MSKILDELKALKIARNYLFRGLASADSVINGSSEGTSAGVSIVQEQRNGGVFADLLEEKETQQVKIMRDKWYRILKESDKYDANRTLKLKMNDDGEVERFENTPSEIGKVYKKSKEDFMKHSVVYEEEGTKLRTIQDNKKMPKHTMFDFDSSDLTINPEFNVDTTLEIERDGFSPRIEIEKFVKKMVVRNIENSDRAFIDLYLPSEASQFGKIDAILVSQLFNLLETKNKRSDLTDFSKIKWFSDRGWNTEEGSLFEYDDVKYTDIISFDGNFVLIFNAHILNDGTGLFDKYKTKEVDEYYSNNSKNGNEIGLSTALKFINKEEKQSLNENSN